MSAAQLPRWLTGNARSGLLIVLSIAGAVVIAEGRLRVRTALNINDAWLELLQHDKQAGDPDQ